MLVVLPETRERLARALEYASELDRIGRFGAKDSLESSLLCLHLFACRWDFPELTVCSLYTDWAEHSFAFSIKRCTIDPEGMPLLDSEGKVRSYEERAFFSGGLIFHPGATGPDRSLSVELVGSDKPHWSIHS